MGDWVVLVCAVLGSLAAGVLAALGLCHAMFTLFRMSAPHHAPDPNVPVSTTATILEG